MVERIGGLEANYLGYHDGQGYWVNVKTANPTGMIGDAGIIRRFDSKEDAKAYANEVNSTGMDVFVRTTKPQENRTQTEPPEISWGRACTGFLTQDQVNAINETRRLPDNVKIMRDGLGGYILSYNYLGIRAGTHTIPEGFEIKRDVLGIAHVLPKDTFGLFYRD